MILFFIIVNVNISCPLNLQVNYKSRQFCKHICCNSILLFPFFLLTLFFLQLQGNFKDAKKNQLNKRNWNRKTHKISLKSQGLEIVLSSHCIKGRARKQVRLLIHKEQLAWDTWISFYLYPVCSVPFQEEWTSTIIANSNTD